MAESQRVTHQVGAGAKRDLYLEVRVPGNRDAVNRVQYLT